MARRCFARFSPLLLLSAPACKNPSSHLVSSSRQCLAQPRMYPVRPPPLTYLHSRVITTDESPREVVPRSVPVRVAHELLQAGHRYLDVRTVDEFSAGHPAGATNIPYMFKAESGMTKNPGFIEEVSSNFGKDDEIIIGCKSGRRSFMAATELSSAGFTGVTDIAGGYSAWVQNGLP